MSSCLLSISDIEINLLILFHKYSIGFKSGEYGGRYINWMLSLRAFSITIFALCVGKLSRTKHIRFRGLLFLTVVRNWQKSSDLVWFGNSMESWPFSIKQPIELAFMCAVFFFITLGARRVTNTPTFRSGMKWTLARILCSFKNDKSLLLLNGLS